MGERSLYQQASQKEKEREATDYETENLLPIQNFQQILLLAILILANLVTVMIMIMTHDSSANKTTSHNKLQLASKGNNGTSNNGNSGQDLH